MNAKSKHLLLMRRNDILNKLALDSTALTCIYSISSVTFCSALWHCVTAIVHFQHMRLLVWILKTLWARMALCENARSGLNASLQ